MSPQAVLPNPLLDRAIALARGGRIRVRCFTAGPNGHVRPNFESELRALVDALVDTRGERRFAVELAPLTEPQTFIKELRRNRDEIIHVACHGANQSLCFRDQANDSLRVDSDWMVERFAHARSVKLVVLNACDSASIATAIAESPRTAVLAAIGYVGLIDEVALCEFTSAFYSALAEGLTVKRAFDDAKASMECREAASQLRLCGLSNFSMLYKHLIPPILIPWLGGICLGAVLAPVIRKLAKIAALCMAVAFIVGSVGLPLLLSTQRIQASAPSYDGALAATDSERATHIDSTTRIYVEPTAHHSKLDLRGVESSAHQSDTTHTDSERAFAAKVQRIAERKSCPNTAGHHPPIALIVDPQASSVKIQSPPCGSPELCVCISNATQLGLSTSSLTHKLWLFYNPSSGSVVVERAG